MPAKLVDLETARLRRWDRKQSSPFQPRSDGQRIWFCNCGVWQFELHPDGVFCVSCKTKQSVECRL